MDLLDHLAHVVDNNPLLLLVLVPLPLLVLLLPSPVKSRLPHNLHNNLLPLRQTAQLRLLPLLLPLHQPLPLLHNPLNPLLLAPLLPHSPALANLFHIARLCKEELPLLSQLLLHYLLRHQLLMQQQPQPPPLPQLTRLLPKQMFPHKDVTVSSNKIIGSKRRSNLDLHLLCLLIYPPKQLLFPPLNPPQPPLYQHPL